MKHDNDNKGNVLRFVSVCSGIEAASVAWTPLGWKAVAFGEIDRAASAVLAYHYPDVPNLGDFTKIDITQLGRVDILCGGTPCQAFSVAGARKSLADARGNLTLAFVDIAHGLAENNGLRNAVWENVPGVLNTEDNAFGCFLAGIVGADDALRSPDGNRWPDEGMVEGPRARAAWRILDAQHFGLAQRRRRVILVADFGNGADPAAVLFEFASLRRDPPSRREAREGVAHATAPSLTASGRGVERTGESRGQDPVVAMYVKEVCGALNSAGGHAVPGNSVQDATAGQLIAYGGNRTSGPIDVATAVNAHGGACGRMDFESETFICFTAKDYGADAQEDIAPTLRAGGHKDSHQNGGVGPAIAFSNRGIDSGETSETLRASSHGALPMVATSAVRRLTPRECERLQGFPDDYTRIPVRRYDKPTYTKNRPADMWEHIDGTWWLMQADGPRYKQLGNSWAVPKFRWLGERIARLMPPIPANDNKERAIADAA